MLSLTMFCRIAVSDIGLSSATSVLRLTHYDYVWRERLDFNRWLEDDIRLLGKRECSSCRFVSDADDDDVCDVRAYRSAWSRAFKHQR